MTGNITQNRPSIIEEFLTLNDSIGNKVYLNKEHQIRNINLQIDPRSIRWSQDKSYY